MSVSNHILAGNAIALVFHNPLLALPLSLLSHFVLDGLPHFGFRRKGYSEIFKHRISYVGLVLDIIGVGILLLTVTTLSWLLFCSALVAIAPDAGWLYRYFYYERFGTVPGATWFTRFHEKIQWCERPWGLYFEAVFFFTGLWAVYRYLL